MAAPLYAAVHDHVDIAAHGIHDFFKLIEWRPASI